MTARLDAFADAQLDADLSEVLDLPAAIAARPERRRRRSVLARLLSSRRASATIGISLALVAFAGGVIVLDDGRSRDPGVVPAVVSVPRPATRTVAAPAPATQVATVDAEPVVRPPAESVVAAPRRRASAARRQPTFADARPPAATTEADLSLIPTPGPAVPVQTAAVPRDIIPQVVRLPSAIAAPAPVPAVTVDTSDVGNPPVRARRDAVTALRALRRQW